MWLKAAKSLGELREPPGNGGSAKWGLTKTHASRDTS